MFDIIFLCFNKNLGWGTPCDVYPTVHASYKRAFLDISQNVTCLFITVNYLHILKTCKRYMARVICSLLKFFKCDYFAHNNSHHAILFGYVA